MAKGLQYLDKGFEEWGKKMSDHEIHSPLTT